MLTTMIKNASTAERLLEMVERNLGTGIFDEIHVSAAFNKLAKLEVSVSAKVRRSRTLDALIEEAEQLLLGGEADARLIATIFWSAATLHRKVPRMKQLLPALLEMVSFNSQYLFPQGVANIIWGCAKLQLSRPQLQKLLPDVAKRAVDRADDLKAQEVSNIIWSCATLRHDAPELIGIMPAMQEMVTERANDIGPQETANILWSCARLQDKAPALLDVVPVLADQIVRHVDTMSAQHVSNTIWAIASLRERSHVLHSLPLLMTRATKVRSRLSPQGLANIFWASAILKHEAPQMALQLPQLLDEVERKAGDFTAQTIANTVWAVGSARMESKALAVVLQKLQAQGLRLLSTFTTQALANMCWGLALRGHAETGFMKELAATLAPKTAGLRYSAANLDLPQIVCAYAKLGLRHRKLLSAVAERTSPELRRINQWGLCALAWSYDKLDSEGWFVEFRKQLRAEVSRRGISAARVQSSPLGPDVWYRKQ